MIEDIKNAPDLIQKMALEFPIGAVVEVDEEAQFIIGYTDYDEIIISPIWPGHDYEKALKFRSAIDAAYIRTGKIPMLIPSEIKWNA